ncbi:hypothetical protein IC582_030001 [Cucumis melo]|uniref:Zinc finger protein ZAT4-like n=2 Tax=Cucumis melo TaxID=3656 RepID=A0A1S3BJI0_CUCME|nr:zinc finger protein ZAT4-like [Cucumis melo]TYJ98924.1 zinc finger protein ZAT4-like [Cucumis melo var. makuwa]
MEADREFKHFCKLCNRSFPCGRSLGGHMRSHLINSQAETGENLKKMNLKKAGKFLGDGTSDGYSLRKNPRKTCKLAEFRAEDRFCRECGKSFQSWKALFGHMKCHSTETERVSSNLEFDSQSDNETAGANRGKRSRKQTRYMTAEISSSFSFAAAAAAASSSVSDQNDQEQEEVALCLMMLSRDVGGFYSTTESSDNFMPKQVPSPVAKNHFSKVVEAIPSVYMGQLKEFHSRKLKLSEMDSGCLKFEESNSEFSASAVKMNKNEEKFQQDDIFGSSSNNQTDINQLQFDSSKFNSDQRKFHELSNGELRSNSFRRSTPNELNSESYKSKGKRSKFQCNSCNKIFHSYQALGGHRASHKKAKGCLASKTENSENSIETEISNDPTFESKSTATALEVENQQESEIHMGYEKKNRKHHQCSICLKIFSSGQALGGHKRSHLISGSESRNKFPETTSNQKPDAEIRDYLDLNLPAPIDEEGSSHLGSMEPWWVGGSHSHEQALVGLI